jgi:hypothetical protein
MPELGTSGTVGGEGGNVLVYPDAHTIERVCRAYPAHRKAWLRWRGCKSLGVKSLGWVPFNTGHVSCDVEMFTYRGVRYETSVPNTSWAGFRHMLSFKAMTGGGMYLKVNEVYASQVCFCCGVVPVGTERYHRPWNKRMDLRRRLRSGITAT